MGWIQYHDRKRQPDDVWIECDRCAGGVDFSRENEPTDRAHLAGETPQMAWRGYRPMNLCPQCGGEGGTWLPKSKDKNRLNVAYSTREDRDCGKNWQIGLLQTWMPDESRWHPPVDTKPSWQRFWKYDSDTDPEQWEGDK